MDASAERRSASDAFISFINLRILQGNPTLVSGIVVFLFLLLLFPSVWLGSETFVYRDFGHFGYPLAAHYHEVVWSGEFPLWNPYNNTGIPFLAQWNTLCLYPFSLIYLLLPLPWSVNLFTLLHLIWAAMGMAWLARRWTHHRMAALVAGAAFASNGLALTMLMWPNILAAYSWMPWVVGLAERALRRGGRTILWAVLAGGCQMTTGSPEIAALTWIMVGGWCAWRWVAAPRLRFQRPLRLTFVVLLIAALTAVQLLPFVDFLQISHRGAIEKPEQWSLSFGGLLNFFVPLFQTTYLSEGAPFPKDQHWTHSYYFPMGFWLLVLPLFFRRPTKPAAFLGTTAIVGILLAFGQKGGLLPLLQILFPAFEQLRFPIKFITPALFAFSLLAGFGVRNWLKACAPAGAAPDLLPLKASLKPALEKRLLMAASLCAVMVILALAGTYWTPVSQDQPEDVYVNGAVRILFLLGATILVLACIRSTKPRAVFVSGVLLLCLWDGATHMPGLNPSVPSAIFSGSVPDLSPAPGPGGSRTMMTRAAYDQLHGRMLENVEQDYLAHRQGLYANANLLQQMPKLDGFYALYPEWEWEVRYHLLFQSRDKEWPALMDFLGVEWYSSEQNPLEWKRRTTFLPLVTGGQHPLLVKPEETLEMIARPDWNPRTTVVLPEETHLEYADALESSSLVSISDIHQEQNRLTFGVTAVSGAVVVIAQTWHPNWRAFIDGLEKPVLRANHAYQAIEVPAGTHTVELYYTDRSFLAGTGISLATLLGLGFLWVNSGKSPCRKKSGSRAVFEVWPSPPSSGNAL